MASLGELEVRLSFASDAVEKLISLVRAEALEEAAKKVTEHYEELCTEHRLLLLNRAAAIRELKEKSST